jgi:hypothetical protein
MYETMKEHFRSYTVVLEPERNVPEWWAGAPSVVRTPDGAFYLAARMREGDSPLGSRGYEIRILKSADGVGFHPVHAIRRETVSVRSLERPALVIDPDTGKFRLYACAVPKEGGWRILKFEDADVPSEVDPATARVVLEPPPSRGLLIQPGYKDPFVLWAEGRWHLYVIGIDRVERTHHFTSHDGVRWDADPHNPVLDNGHWHNFYTRPACVLPIGIGYLFVYEGSNAQWHDPNYNIATGLAYTLDLSHMTDLTPEAPLLVSTTPGRCHTWRYSHWLRVDGQLYVYAECARPNDTNELRLFRLPAPPSWSAVP